MPCGKGPAAGQDGDRDGQRRPASAAGEPAEEPPRPPPPVEVEPRRSSSRAGKNVVPAARPSSTAGHRRPAVRRRPPTATRAAGQDVVQLRDVVGGVRQQQVHGGHRHARSASRKSRQPTKNSPTTTVTWHATASVRSTANRRSPPRPARPRATPWATMAVAPSWTPVTAEGLPADRLAGVGEGQPDEHRQQRRRQPDEPRHRQVGRDQRPAERQQVDLRRTNQTSDAASSQP